MIKLLPGFVLALITLVSCVASVKPTTELVDAKAAVRGAEEVGAANEPQAALYLKMARDHIAAAEREIADDDHDVARRWLQKARADAELALVLTRSAHRTAEARAALARVDQLQRQQ
jgi:hypothetical protein